MAGTFFGSRLREARLARQMTASMLAERVGVSPGAISQHENHNAEPRPQTLAKMAEVLAVPVRYFLRPLVGADPAPRWYRSRAAATKRARESAEVRHSWLREIALEVETHVELPSPGIPLDFAPTNPATLHLNEIENIAGEIRRAWKLGEGPAPNMVSLLERMGCVVASFAFGANDLSAFSQPSSDRPYVILNGDELASVRRRFNVAHELGHLVLHRHVSQADAARPEVHKAMEVQAHRFAGAFLFPARPLADEVYSVALDALTSVKSRWKVSVQLIIRRLLQLNLISQDRYERLCREISRRGFRSQEPLDDSIPIEQPTLLSKAIMMLINENVMTRDEIKHRLPYAPDDIEVLTSLERGYLSPETWGEVEELKIRGASPSPAPVSETKHDDGRIIPFRPKLQN
jgi:Zn-dependent peptidase ImmA (M78 family)/transcriptional regulator with XRE-family HTH domain